MRVWHFNWVITTYGKRDCRNSWQYTSLAVNRGAIKGGFTVSITPPSFMKFCRVLPEICRGQVHVPKKERKKGE